mgnify:CR=1 FL=1
MLDTYLLYERLFSFIFRDPLRIIFWCTYRVYMADNYLVEQLNVLDLYERTR